MQADNAVIYPFALRFSCGELVQVDYSPRQILAPQEMQMRYGRESQPGGERGLGSVKM
jgi:hypothetical protein